MKRGFELSDVISRLRSELQIAEEEGNGHDLKFGVETIDLEIKVGATESDEVKGGIKLWVLSFGTKSKAEDEQAITVKLRLTPRKRMRGHGATTGDIEVSRVATEVTKRQRRNRRS